MKGQMGLFAEEERLKMLSEPGDNLEKLSVIDRELFRPTPERAQPRSDGVKGGSPRMILLMFIILVLRRLYKRTTGSDRKRVQEQSTFSVS